MTGAGSLVLGGGLGVTAADLLGGRVTVEVTVPGLTDVDVDVVSGRVEETGCR